MMKALTAAALTATVLTAPAVAHAKPICRDPIVKVIKDAGFKGAHVRIAYAVAWRESNHRPGESTYPDLGLFQLNKPSWGRTKYWPANPLNAQQNARAAHRIWRDHSWRPWGLNRNGTGVDTRDYNWNSWRVTNWIWRPYVTGLNKFDRLPKACRR